MSGSGGSSIIAAWAVAGELGPKPPHDGSRQAELDRDELRELEAKLCADLGGRAGPVPELELAPVEGHIHLLHRPQQVASTASSAADDR